MDFFSGSFEVSAGMYELYQQHLNINLVPGNCFKHLKFCSLNIKAKYKVELVLCDIWYFFILSYILPE